MSRQTSATLEQLREMQGLMLQLEPKVAARVLAFTRSVARSRNCCRPKNVAVLLQEPAEQKKEGSGRVGGEQVLRNFAFGDAT